MARSSKEREGAKTWVTNCHRGACAHIATPEGPTSWWTKASVLRCQGSRSCWATWRQLTAARTSSEPDANCALCAANPSKPMERLRQQRVGRQQHMAATGCPAEQRRDSPPKRALPCSSAPACGIPCTKPGSGRHKWPPVPTRAQSPMSAGAGNHGPQPPPFKTGARPPQFCGEGPSPKSEQKSRPHWSRGAPA